VALKIQPELRAVAEIQAQPKRRVGRDAPPVVGDPGDPVRRNPDRLRDLALRQTMRREAFLLRHFAGRDRRKFVSGHRRFLSTIIRDPILMRRAA
jgi:hypothetical protein